MIAVLNDSDKKDLFSDGDINRLQRFIKERCYSSIIDRSWLNYIAIENLGETDYFGYW